MLGTSKKNDNYLLGKSMNDYGGTNINYSENENQFFSARKFMLVLMVLFAALFVFSALILAYVITDANNWILVVIFSAIGIGFSAVGGALAFYIQRKLIESEYLPIAAEMSKHESKVSIPRTSITTEDPEIKDSDIDLSTPEGQMQDLRNKLKSKTEQLTQSQELVSEMQRTQTLLQDTMRYNEDEIARLETINFTKQEKMHKLSVELDKSKSELMDVSGGGRLDESFPSVEDLITEFEAIQTSAHSECHGHIAGVLRQRNKNWHPLYASQYSHKLLFRTLMDTFEIVIRYREQIFAAVGTTLQIEHVTAKMGGDEKQDKASTAENRRAKLEYVFHSYLQSNCDALIETQKDDIFKQILTKTKSVVDFLKMIPNRESMNKIKDLLGDYVDRCVILCWKLVLCQPELTLYPNTFQANANTAFDEKAYRALRGSEKNPKYVLYHVWPTVLRGGKRLDVQIAVMARSEPIPKLKKKKPKK